MKFRKLLAGTAVAALMVGNAHALDVALGDTGAMGTVAATAIEAPVQLALEADLTDTANNGTFVLDVTTVSSIASANNYIIGVSVSGGSFATQVAAADLLNGDGTTPTVFNGTTVQFDGSDRTGEIGDTSVRFLSSATQGGTDFRVEIDAAADCTSPLTFTVSLQTEAGTPIEEGVATLAAPAVTCVNAFSASVASDVVAGANDSELLSPDFDTFNATISQPASVGGGTDTATVANLGVVTLVGDPGMTGLPIFPSLADAEDSTMGALDTANPQNEINEVELSVSVSSAAGIEGFAELGGMTNALTGTSVTFDFNPAAEASGIQVEIEGSTTVQPQTPTVTAGTISFANAALDDGEAIVLTNGGALDDLNYEGDECGTFDWVGDSTTSRRNVFRATNFEDANVQGVFATMANSSAGMPPATAMVTPIETDSELLITDAQLTAAFGEFGRADFSFSFISATDVDCDRLQTSPAATIVTGFGNGTGLFGDGDDN